MNEHCTWRPQPAGQRYSLFDDLQGLCTGTLFVAIGLVLPRHAALVTGGTAGVALLLHHTTGQLTMSVPGAVAMNFALAVNHKPRRSAAF